jgi:hypothetical protein
MNERFKQVKKYEFTLSLAQTPSEIIRFIADRLTDTKHAMEKFQKDQSENRRHYDKAVQLNSIYERKDKLCSD